MFVDGDDWVEPDFCRIPMAAAEKFHADLVIFQNRLERNGMIRNKRRKSKCLCGVVNVEFAIIYGGVAVWNKLYRRELFDNIRYPEGKVHEDTATTHKLVQLSKRIVFLDECLYNYVWRKDSISHTQIYSYKKDWFTAVTLWYKELMEFGCSQRLLEKKLYETAISCLARVYPNDDRLYHEAEEIVDNICGIPSFLEWRCKIALLIWRTNKGLFHTICRTLGFKVK